VDIALQGLQVLIAKQESWEVMRKKLATLIRFALYANYYAQAAPLAQVVQDTAQVRDMVLNGLKLDTEDSGVYELLKAPFRNSTLFPG
jgi:hypothetical protein